MSATSGTSPSVHTATPTGATTPPTGTLRLADRQSAHQPREHSSFEALRQRLGPLILILLLGLLFFAPLLLHPSWVLYSDYSDLLTYQVPQMRFLVGSWQKTGQLPLWNPYSFAGMPFIHDLQVGAFYPPHLVLYFLREEMVG